MAHIRLDLLSKLTDKLREAMTNKSKLEYDHAMKEISTALLTGDECDLLDATLDEFRKKGIYWNPTMGDTVLKTDLYVTEKYGNFLLNEWCIEIGCRKSKQLVTVEGSECHCGATTYHTHCKNCGGIIPSEGQDYAKF